MTIIEVFEKRIIKNGLSEEDFMEYEKLLKRVRGNFLRLQHCYTTAAHFPQKRSAEAIRLIEWGLEKYSDSWFPTYSAYYNMGLINENCGKYATAYEAYQQAADILDKDKKPYRQTISGNLLWMLLHIDGFQYSGTDCGYRSVFRGKESSICCKMHVRLLAPQSWVFAGLPDG